MPKEDQQPFGKILDTPNRQGYLRRRESQTLRREKGDDA
jgi:hypothetical protein